MHMQMRVQQSNRECRYWRGKEETSAEIGEGPQNQQQDMTQEIRHVTGHTSRSAPIMC